MKPGQRIGADFRLLERHGKHVWKAERISTGEPLAIRFAPEAIQSGPAERARFAQDAQRAQEIESSRIVETVGFGLSDDGLPYLVMEWLEGEGLAERLGRERSLGRSTLVTVLRQLAEALDAAHARDIVHGDLRPEKVFLLAGHDVRVKVLDLGMSRRPDHASDYASPESFDGEVTPAGDRWSLAVIAYRGLTGRRPFGGDEASLRRAIRRGDYLPPSDLVPSLPLQVDGWFARALAVDPADRFTSAEAMVDALEAALRASRARPRALPFLDALVLVATAVAGLLVGALIALRDGL